jgi:hypothetical protein
MPEGSKRERWTEADVRELPAGEHDFFDRKSGRVFDSTEQLKGTLAKAVGALANSGGGHLILGVTDAGDFDGVPPMRGRTPTREWLEQLLPPLLAHPLADFRVHEVVPDEAESAIPQGQAVIVIDVGDSALAPHQCVYEGGGSTRGIYYQRQGGHSVPASHFYLELLRQRLTAPALEAKFPRPSVWSAARMNGALFLGVEVNHTVTNAGRIAAYKWAVQARWKVALSDRERDYLFDKAAWPVKDDSPSSIRLDTTLLPGATIEDRWRFGLVLRTWQGEVGFINDLNRLLAGLSFEYRLATEASLSEYTEIQMDALVGDHDLLVDALEYVPDLFV